VTNRRNNYDEEKFKTTGYRGNSVAELIKQLQKLPKTMLIEVNGNLGFSVKMVNKGSVQGIRAEILPKDNIT
jgi:hypothetical protein